MSNEKLNEPDNGYKSVLKEYDYYNNTENDFEIIDEYENNYTNNQKNNINKEDEIKQKSKFQNFIADIFKIIFNSRNQSSEFYTKSKKKLKANSFQIDLDELIEYENLRATNYNNDKKKYFIDFYLIKNDNEKDNNSLNSARINDKKNIIVERWKIKYREKINKNKIKDFELYLNKKMKIIEKSIVTYSRILPLYNILKKDKYSIDFKFCQKNKKKLFDKDSTYKIKLNDDNLFSFKLSIKYLKINPENIETFFQKNSTEFVIIPSKKSRRRFLSDSYHKKSSAQLLNTIENNHEEKSKENANNIENCIDDRRLSYEPTYNTKQYINSKFQNKEKNDSQKFKINESGSICSQDDEENLSLVINESDNDIFKTPNEINKVNTNIIKTEMINNNSTKESTPRKCQTYKEATKYKSIKSSELSTLSVNNADIKKILIDYKNTRRMLSIMPDYLNINNQKLLRFISNEKK